MRYRKYKKIFSLFLVFAMVFCSQAIAFAEETNPLAQTAVISVGTVEAKAGATVKVPVKLSNNQLPVIGCASFGVSYDTDVLEYSSLKAGLFEDEMTLANPGIAPGYIKIDCISDQGISVTAGTLFTLTFHVKEDIPVGTTANIALTVSALCDFDTNDINISGVEILNGSVLVPSDVDFVVGEVTVNSSQQDVTVPVMIQNNRSKIGAYDYTIYYDAERLTFRSVDKNDTSVEITDTPGQVKISALHKDPVVDTAAQLEIFHFDAAEVMADTDTAVSIQLEMVSDYDGEEIPLDNIVTKNGTVMILSKYDATFSVPDVTVEDGQEMISIPVSMSNNRLAVYGMTIEIGYDADLLEYAGPHGEVSDGDGIWVINDSEEAPGTVTAMYMSLSGMTAKERELFCLDFKPKAADQELTGLITIQSVRLADAASEYYENIELEYKDGQVTIQASTNAARTAAVEKINEAYASYDEAAYSEENWAVLTAAKEAGVKAVEDAGTAEAAAEAAEEAVRVMNSVYRLGDIDRDGDVDTNDALLALQAASGEKEWNDSYLAEGDMNRDGKITAVDAYIILKQVLQ